MLRCKKFTKIYDKGSLIQEFDLCGCSKYLSFEGLLYSVNYLLI